MNYKHKNSATYRGCQKIALWLKTNSKTIFVWDDLPKELKTISPKKAHSTGLLIRVGSDTTHHAIWRISPHVEARA
jgi:phosphoenolpyruvate-protein kinase (PTS system EI component)